VNNVINLRL